MGVALDLGTHAARSLRLSKNKTIRRQCRSVALLIPDGVLARTRLEQFQVPFVACDDRLAIPGDPAAEMAELFGAACQDLLPEGQVPYADPVTRQLIAMLIESLIPAASQEGVPCCFSQPGYGQNDEGMEDQFDRRLEFVSRVIRLRGYEPVPINPALALILAEMETEQFTGVGISVGASGCDLVLSHRGAMLAAARVPRGGRALDELLAVQARRFCVDSFGQCVLDLEWSRRRREFAAPAQLSSDESQVLEQALNDLVVEIVLGLDRLLSTSRWESGEPLTIVLGGGLAQSRAFESRLRKQIRRAHPGLYPSHIRLAGNAESAVTRGCLIQSLLEARSQPALVRIPA